MAFEKLKAQIAEPVRQSMNIAMCALAIALLALLVALGGRHHGA